LDKLQAWEQRYGFRIAITPEHGYIFSDLNARGACCWPLYQTCFTTFLILRSKDPPMP
jgi:hypothetical protein